MYERMMPCILNMASTCTSFISSIFFTIFHDFFSTNLAALPCEIKIELILSVERKEVWNIVLQLVFCPIIRSRERYSAVVYETTEFFYHQLRQKFIQTRLKFVFTKCSLQTRSMSTVFYSTIIWKISKVYMKCFHRTELIAVGNTAYCDFRRREFCSVFMRIGVESMNDWPEFPVFFSRSLYMKLRCFQQIWLRCIFESVQNKTSRKYINYTQSKN